MKDAPNRSKIEQPINKALGFTVRKKGPMTTIVKYYK